MQHQPIVHPAKRNLRGHMLPPVLHPDPILAAEGLSITFIERFLAKVRKTETCWLWEGAGESNHGRLLRGKRLGGNISFRAAAWLLHNGEIPTGMEILKACPFGIADCVHPNHIRAGTHDQIREIRYAAKQHAELTNEQIRRFETLCEQAGKSHADMLMGFEITHKTPQWMIDAGFSDTFAERFFRKIERRGECLIWIGAINSDGYGMIGTGGNGKVISAHRGAWMLKNGPIPEGQEVCHNCPGVDNPACVNVDHFFLGSSKQNSVDAAEKFRQRTGAHWNSKFTPSDIQQIKEMFNAGQNMVEIGKRFGVNRSHISRIVNGQRHVYDLSPGEFLLRCP